MTHLSTRLSSIATLGQTLLIAFGGYLLVLTLATATTTTMTHRELLVGPLALGLLWAGLRRSELADS